MTTNHNALRFAASLEKGAAELRLYDSAQSNNYAMCARMIRDLVEKNEALAASKPDHLCPGCEGNPAPENNPCAVCGTSKPEHEYHFIGYVDGYGREIKDKDARMKLPRAVYFRAERSMK